MKRVLALLVGASVVAALAIATAEVAAPPPAPAAAPPAANAAASATVKIIFTTVPMKKAFVSWGKRRLGMIAPHAPLIIERPRDSGPLDVVIHSDGFITVQTRAYTFADSKVAVKLTALDQKKTVLGYREELPPSPPDGGAPPAPSASAIPSTRMGPDAGAR